MFHVTDHRWFDLINCQKLPSLMDLNRVFNWLLLISPPAIPQLDGDLHALSLIDLDSVGLGWYKDRIAGYSAPSQEKCLTESASAAAININEQYGCPLECPDQQINSSDFLSLAEGSNSNCY